MTGSYLCDDCAELATALVNCAAILSQQASSLAALAGTLNAEEYKAQKTEILRIESECESLRARLTDHRAAHVQPS